MFIAVIRRDIEKAIFLADVEPKSLANPPTESWKGQSRYLSPPNVATIAAYLTAQSQVNGQIVPSTGWTTTNWTGTYPNFTHTTGHADALSNTLAAVANEVYSITVTITGRTAGSITVAFGGVTSSALTTTTVVPVTASTTGNLVITPGSTFDGTVSVTIQATTIPLTGTTASAAATALIAATIPPYTGGAITLSNYKIDATTIRAVSGIGTPGLTLATNAQVAALQNLLASHFVETDVVKKSFLNGNIKGFLSPYVSSPLSGFNPDPHKLPAYTPGQAIVCLADDGTTQFTVKTPIVTGAATNTPGSGALRITGSSGGLSGYGLYETSVILIGKGAKRITQEQILAGGGTITDTQIDIPAAVVLGPVASNTYGAIAATLTQVRVQVNDMLSPAFTCT